MMSTKDFQEIATQVKEYSDYIYLHVKGEPLTHPYLKEILDIAYNLGLQVNLTTNGTKINEVVEILFSSKALRQVNISLHAIVGLDDEAKKNYLDNICNLIEKLSVEKKFFLSLRIWIENDEINKYIIEYISKRLNVDINIATEKIMDNVFLSFEEEFSWPNINGDIISNTGRCLGTRDQIAILANGDVVPCCLDGNGIIRLGNIFENKLETILNTSRFLTMKSGFENERVVEDLCQRCSYRLRFEKN